MKVRIIKMGKYCKGLILDLPNKEADELIKQGFAIESFIDGGIVEPKKKK